MTEFAGVEAFKRSSGRRITTVEIPSLGSVRLRSLKTSEYAKVESIGMQAYAELTAGRKSEGTRKLLESKVLLVSLCVVNENGDPLFSKADADLIRDLDSGVLSELEKACTKHCGIEGVDVEELAKN